MIKRGKKGIDRYIKWFDEKYGLNYKCPECNGEFNQSASNCTEEGTSIVRLTNYRCPFCGFKMEGLNK